MPFRLDKAVQLRINGLAPSGLTDRMGRLIDGDHDGQPGGDAIARLRSNGISLLHSSDKLTEVHNATSSGTIGTSAIGKRSGAGGLNAVRTEHRSPASIGVDIYLIQVGANQGYREEIGRR